MSDRKLKHYDKYLTRLLTFSTAMGVEVIFKSYDGNGAWVPTLNRVVLDDNMSNTDTIATFLHELGHSIEDLFEMTEKEIQFRNKAYDAIYGDYQTRKQMNYVLSSEQKAWNSGREIAKRLHIRLGKWYTDIEKSCLDNYKGVDNENS